MTNRVTFMAQPQAAVSCRRWVREQAARTFQDADRVLAIELVTSELVTNAIEHGTGSTFSVEVCDSELTFDVEVCSGSGLSVPSHDPDTWEMADENQASGRGLAIVRACSDSVEVRRQCERLAVRCSFWHHLKVDQNLRFQR